MPSRPLASKELLFTLAPLAIAAGFAYAAHGGLLCSGGGHQTEVKVVAKAERGTSVDIYRDGRKVNAKRRRAQRDRNGVDPMALGKRVYRAMETFWVPRSVVEKLVADPGLLKVSGDLVAVRECSGLAGYRVENTVRGGVIRRMGFRDGDLITAINGVHFESRREALRAISGIETADQLAVTIIRGDKTLQKTFLIE